VTNITAMKNAFRKALATFIFSSAGALVGINVFDADVEAWKVAASLGIGALINLAYRWAETEMKKDAPE
jgi:hypothetical protein